MLIIFDCDGVLVDSEILSAQVDCEILAEYGYEVSAEELAHRYAGLTTDRIFELAGEELGRPIPPAAIRRAELETDRRLGAEVKALPGAQEMLDALDGPRCICSNSRSERLRITLTKARLWDRFRPYVYSARDVGEGRGKPAPDVFLHAAAALDSDPAEAVVIEDSVAGVTGAVAAGMRVIGFTGASHSWPGHGEALMDAGALTVVRRLTDVPGTIEALRQWRPETV
jgi:HAD superfamily hydrolase (TIGR01509 family)